MNKSDGASDVLVEAAKSERLCVAAGCLMRRRVLQSQVWREGGPQYNLQAPPPLHASGQPRI